MTAPIEQETHVQFKLLFRDTAHFYKVVRKMNELAGQGKENWTIDGKVLKHLKQGNSITRNVRVFNKDFDQEAGLLLALS